MSVLLDQSRSREVEGDTQEEGCVHTCRCTLVSPILIVSFSAPLRRGGHMQILSNCKSNKKTYYTANASLKTNSYNVVNVELGFIRKASGCYHYH